MTELERGERLQIMLSAEELEAVENWRFEKRMPSRAAAVRELLRRGLAAEGFAMAKSGVRSRDFGVIESGSDEPAIDPGDGSISRE
ncbi:hypothetical protein KEU06_15770 [Pseudaminobacter sp. 19-2017]|uniref:Ribbon-helix-helix protein, CopG family n=1 Tax=Pseudaminobacter soli (ex Zhang et al. 2022) TaxID=2831468 RepID=A0A942E3T0_9HYPH|nr:hypothetical protein [Pseudaminobacter soli]MBS3650070.1 hypothetical protein [Pseudaminobacter soli]